MIQIHFFKQCGGAGVILRHIASATYAHLLSHRFRTVLSLIGVGTGIFTIVMVVAAVDALKRNVESGLATLSPDILHISTWPLEGEDEYGVQSPDYEYRWWDYMRRPPVSARECKYVASALEGAALSAYCATFSAKVSSQRHSLEEVEVMRLSKDWEELCPMELQSGRWFSTEELQEGAAVALLGHNVASGLFPNEDAVGAAVMLEGVRVRVIGLCARAGESITQLVERDNALFLPYNCASFGSKGALSLYLKPAEGLAQAEFIERVSAAMRAARRIAPAQRENFSINRLSLLADSAEELFSLLRNVGWIIAAFSLLVGGFGIANIMYCSIKERTHIIGVQKALGARRGAILLQFLMESIAIALCGAVVGIALSLVAIALLPDGLMELSLTANALWSGVATAFAVGLSSGYLPARSASLLPPAEALSAK